MLFLAILLTQTPQTPTLDLSLPKLAEYGVAILAIYALLTLIRNNGKQDTQQAATLDKSIEFNGRVLEMLNELKAARREDNAAHKEDSANLQRAINKSTGSMNTMTEEVRINTKATIDHYKASAQSISILNRGMDRAERHFNKRVDEMERLIRDNHAATLRVIGEAKPSPAPERNEVESE